MSTRDIGLRASPALAGGVCAAPGRPAPAIGGDTMGTASVRPAAQTASRNADCDDLM
jgi:hypothetical protein